MAKDIIPRIPSLRDSVIRLNELMIDKKSNNLAQMMEWMGIQPGHSLYSSVYGPVILLEVNEQKIKVKDKSDHIFEFTLEGKLHEEGEVVLFPDKDKEWKPVPKSASPPKRREFTGYGIKYSLAYKILVESFQVLGFKKSISTTDDNFIIIDSEIIENSYKFLGFMASTATEVDDLFDKAIKCGSFCPFMNKEQKSFYTIAVRTERNHDKNRDVAIIYDIKIDMEDKGNLMRVPAFFCFSSYAALLYFLHEYRMEIKCYIKGLYCALNYPHSFRLPLYSEEIERDIWKMFPKPSSRTMLH